MCHLPPYAMSRTFLLGNQVREKNVEPPAGAGKDLRPSGELQMKSRWKPLTLLYLFLFLLTCRDALTTSARFSWIQNLHWGGEWGEEHAARSMPKPPPDPGTEGPQTVFHGQPMHKNIWNFSEKASHKGTCSRVT